VLYEFHYYDAEDAESLITRILIHNDPEEGDSLQRETTVVTDEMVRWDNESAPPLVVRGRLSIERLVILDYLPDPAPTRGVTITRTFNGATGSPTMYPTLDDFLSAASDLTAPDRHARLAYTTLSDFLEDFTDAGETIPLGDWDEDGVADQYQPRALARKFTGLAIDAVDDTKVSSVAKPFDPNDVGKIINITEGAGFIAGRYKITEVDASHVATLDRPCGTAGSTDGTGKIERVHILELPTVADRLEIVFHGDALDQTGVMYLRAVPT
jgi:hypothetical protein